MASTGRIAIQNAKTKSVLWVDDQAMVASRVTRTLMCSDEQKLVFSQFVLHKAVVELRDFNPYRRGGLVFWEMRTIQKSLDLKHSSADTEDRWCGYNFKNVMKQWQHWHAQAGGGCDRLSFPNFRESLEVCSGPSPVIESSVSEFVTHERWLGLVGVFWILILLVKFAGQKC